MTEVFFYVGQGTVVVTGLVMFLWGLNEANNYWFKKDTTFQDEG